MNALMSEKDIEQVVDNIVENLDRNKTGTVDYTEYLVLAINKEKLITRDKLQKAFKTLDLVRFE